MSSIYMHTTSQNYRNVAVNLLSNCQRLSNEQELKNTIMARRYKSMFPHLFQEKHQTINNACVLIIRD